MPQYLALRDTWLGHENKLVKAGDKFETTFPPGPDGKPMRLGSNLELVKDKAGGKQSTDPLV